MGIENKVMWKMPVHSEALRATKWIPVGEQLPTHHHSVLGWVVSGGLVSGVRDPMIDIVSYGGMSDPRWLQFVGDAGDTEVQVTHWMPLPNDPPPNAGVSDMDQIVFALERAERDLTTAADRLFKAGDYSAEFPGEDAARMREAICVLRASHPTTTGKYAPTLAPFVALMERELHANSGKGDRKGWLTMSRETATLEIYHHTAKLAKAARDNDQPRIQEYAADVANMAMMLLDVCGGLVADDNGDNC